MDIFVAIFGYIKLLLILVFCYVAGAYLFAGRRGRNGIGLAIVWFVGGFCLVSFLFLLSKVIGSGLVVIAFLPVLFLSLHAYRKPNIRVGVEYQPSELGWALALSVVSSLPVLVMGIRMGAGEFPSIFFNGDTPYYLHQIYALVSTGSYPPPSFEIYSVSFKYHYGFQAFVALASLLTHLKPHFVMFNVVVPLLEVLTGLLIYDICRRLTGRHSAALACLLLVLFGSKQYLINYLDPSAWEFVTRAGNYNFHYAHPTSVIGLLISLGIVRCVIEFDQRNMRFAALFFVSMLPLFKIPYLIPMGAGLAFIYFYELKKQFKFNLLFEIVGAGLLSLMCYMIFAKSDIVTDMVIGFNVPGFLKMTMGWQNQTLIVFSTLVAITAVAKKHSLSDGMTRLLIFVLSPYFLFLMFSFENPNDYQIFILSLMLAALFTASYVVSAWFNRDRKISFQYVIAIGVFIGLIGPGVISLCNHIYIVTYHPEKGHEYADNRSVADALRHIPLENTLIVTNDLRYPANNYVRNYRQFQLAGVFGHRNFASNLLYGAVRNEERNLYAALLQLFQSKTWPTAQIDYLRGKVPITHVLIHKHYSHADDIPLNLVYENKDYAVYRF